MAYTLTGWFPMSREEAEIYGGDILGRVIEEGIEQSTMVDKNMLYGLATIIPVITSRFIDNKTVVAELNEIASHEFWKLVSNLVKRWM